MSEDRKLGNLDPYEMQNRGFDAEKDAQRVSIVGGDIRVSAQVDNTDLLNCMKCMETSQEAFHNYIKYEMEQFKEKQPETIVVPKIEIVEIEKQVIVKEPQIIEIEKRVEVPVYKTIEIPYFTEKIVQIPLIEKQKELTNKLDKFAIIIQGLVILGFLISIIVK